MYGGTYMLAKPDVEVVWDEATGRAAGVRSEGQVAKAGLVVGDPSYFPKKARPAGGMEWKGRKGGPGGQGRGQDLRRLGACQEAGARVVWDRGSGHKARCPMRPPLAPGVSSFLSSGRRAGTAGLAEASGRRRRTAGRGAAMTNGPGPDSLAPHCPPAAAPCAQVHVSSRVVRAICIMSHPIPSTNDSHSVQASCALCMV